jgi:putative ABC transport system permease protein
MLELKKISKVYKLENFKQKALDNISINFRNCEFVSILGPSGSGKTTLLNIIGGLDNYTSGDLIINGISTKKYNDRDWDTYRNHKIGFVFQSYNLITHQTVLSNVELALTLSGVKSKERKKRAKDALKKVGLIEHINKKPNQLSGGQMQRVAIARALVNNPDILLADEPTGALDSKTSVQIMNLLKEVAKDRLVIMVTHNSDLAEKYSTRIIDLKDGEIKGDTNPYNKSDENNETTKDKKTNMNFLTALSLSLNNLMTKKGRTILTAFAGSIGIIGIALILSLSSGVQNYINRVQEETLTSYPLMIEDNSVDLTSVMTEQMDKLKKDENTKQSNKIYSNNMMTDTLSIMSSKVQSNNLKSFKEYIEKNKEINKYTTSIDYKYNIELQLYKSDIEDKIVKVNPNTILSTMGITDMQASYFMFKDVFSEIIDNDELNNQMYEIVSGRMPKNYNEVVLVVDKNNRISDYVLYALGLKDQQELKDMFEKVRKGEKVVTTDTSYEYSELIGLKFKLLLNTDYYEKVNGLWIDKSEDEEFLREKLKDSEEITIVGIIKPNKDSAVTSSTLGGILYTDSLEKHVLKKVEDSQIVKEQKQNPEINIITGLEFSDEEFNINDLSFEQQMYLSSLNQEELAEVITKYKESYSLTYEKVLEKLGSIDLDNPSGIYIYAKDFESKDAIKNIINDYNEQQRKNSKDANVINYNDVVGMLMSSVTDIVDIISYVLISFVSISLVVSSIMIGIITYISVLERTKEIGILRAIGASKKDVSRVFNAETLIIGFTSGMFGILITVLLNIPINIIIKKLTGVSNITQLPLNGAIILIMISVILTIIAGLIPAKLASKKDPVESLRSE